MGRDRYGRGVDPDEHARRASAFGTAAAAYAEHRPDYPAAALEWGLAPVRDRVGLRVLDLAAGTGKLTAGLVALGLDVVAVEPDPAMLAELRARFPEVEALPGSAEEIPLPDGSVDAITVGQALHWFDLGRAVPEFRRVLRPDGVLVALWNTYDARVPWVSGFCDVSGAHRYAKADPADPGTALPEVEVAEFPHRLRRTADSLVATTATLSAALILAPAERAAHLGRIRDYLHSTPETATGEFEVPLVTETVRSTFR